jgi:hypothetical protein
VSRAGEAVELREGLRHGLVEVLARSGWSAVGAGRVSPFVLVQLERPLVDGFAATAEVMLSSVTPDGPPVRITDVDGGVAYEPLRRWWPLLGDRFEGSLLATSLARPDSAEAEDDEEAAAGDDVGPLFEVTARPEVPDVVEALASMVAQRAVPFAERYASVEELLAALRDGDDEGRVDIRVPALLAAAGRFDEAAAALARYEPPAEAGGFARRERRTAYQLRRWVAGRGDQSLLPDGPPPSGFADPSEQRSFADIRTSGRARREAVEAVRRTGRGRDRGEVRALLEHELARRGVTESPLALEHTLDHLWDTPGDRIRGGVQGLRALGRLGLGVAKAIRDHELPDLSTPEWLEPPEPAFYELPRSDRWILVSLDPDIGARLDRIHRAARPRVADIAFVPAWLQADGSDAAGIGVFIGRDRVGVIPDDAVAAYRPTMHAARFRDEWPCLPARLARRTQPPSYLLELAMPPPGT